MKRPAMLHSWDQLSFVHWPYAPAAVQQLLPAGLSVDTHDGRAWVGIVPFHVSITIPRAPEIPWVSHFEEVNVRTYVRGPDGATGVWFISLDAARLGAAVVARATHGLPYTWAAMNFTRSGSLAIYQARRRARGRASCDLAVEIGDVLEPDDLGPLDHFLTTRWRFFCMLRRGLAEGLATHDPWPLCRARVIGLEETLLEAAGLDPPEGEPIVHYSEGVDVAMSAPTVVKRP